MTIDSNGNGHVALNGHAVRPPPHNLDCEQGVLGSILLDNDVLPKVSALLTVEDFYRDAHQILYRTILDLAARGAPIDVLTMCEELERRGQLEQVGGDDAFAKIMRTTPHAANAEYYAGIVRQKSIQRHVIEVSNQVLEDAYSNSFTAEELLEGVERRIVPAQVRLSGAGGGDSGNVRSLPEPLDEVAFHGPAGSIVRLIEPHTSADPVAILVQLLAGFGNMVGRRPFVRVEATTHHANLFLAVCGATARAKKGTSLDIVRALLKACDPEWAEERIQSGLVSGEGLIHAVRDPDVTDKRLLCVESEFGSMLRVMARDGNSLSGVTRQFWDSGNGRSMSKNNPLKATGAHVSIIGHVTADEVTRTLGHVDVSNGFANRFLWFWVRRSKILPRGGRIGEVIWNPILERLRCSAEVSRQTEEVDFDAEAGRLWDASYAALTADRPGLLGSVLARSDAQTLRLALIYALLDGRDAIGVAHLKAALALWRHAEQSAEWIFGDALGDRDAEKLLAALRASPIGLTRWQIYGQVFHRHLPSQEIDRILGILTGADLIRREQVTTGGRPSERWHATKGGCAESAESAETPPR